MSKIVKLTQSDIENIVSNIVNEQETGGYQLPDGDITYDTEDEVSDEVDTIDPVEEGLDEGLDGDEGLEGDGEEQGTPAGVSLGIGQDGYLYAIDPKTMSVVSRIKM